MASTGGAGAVRVAAAVVAGRTAIVGCEYRYPARVFALATPGAHAAGAAAVVLSGLGGGLLGGDVTKTSLDVGVGATLLVQTQSATRVFRRRTATGGRGTTASTRVSVASGGLAVIVPDSVVPFAKSHYSSILDVHLGEHARRSHAPSLRRTAPLLT
jgi:urease accessory protein